MLARFKAFIIEKNLISDRQSIVLGVSGGMDSMVMMQLFIKSQHPICVAHVNYNLRGQESKDDAEFVRNYCQTNQIPFYEKEVDLKAEVERDKGNLQERARELRYDWYHQICKNQGYDLIATAHHSNDDIENFLFNFSRNTGYAGLSGIPIRRNNIIRPLLWANRDEINQYARDEKIPFRIDSSNLDNKYSRNFIRNKIIPLFEDLNPGFTGNASNTLGNLKDHRLLFDHLMAQVYDQVTEVKEEMVYLDLQGLADYPAPASILFEMIKKFGFNHDQSLDIINSQQSGSMFFAKSYEALIDRNHVIIRKKRSLEHIDLEIYDSIDMGDYGKIRFEITKIPDTYDDNPRIAYLDYDKVDFPLRIRNWVEGDKFSPLGVKGTQKIKEFLTNNKVSRFEKEKTLVLCSTNQICWLVGWRISNQFRLTEKTKKVLKLELLIP